jgi:hypothetical protein
MAKNLEWWAHGHFYHTDMRILPLGAFDAILGYQWLRQHSPMECDGSIKCCSLRMRINKLLYMVMGIRPVLR